MGGKLGGKWVASFLGTGEAVFFHVKNAMRFRTCEKTHLFMFLKLPVMVTPEIMCDVRLVSGFDSMVYRCLGFLPYNIKIHKMLS